MANDIQPIIIKKIKKGGHGHHGGAWKVAFADFAVAMMAFFMLMWLMGSTTKEQKQAISGYFQDPMGHKDGAGASNSVIDMGGGMNIPTGESDSLEEGYPEDPGYYEANPGAALEYEEETAADLAAEAARLAELREEIIEAVSQDKKLAPFLDQLLIDITNEGLRIQIVDEDQRAMFDSGSARLEPFAEDLLSKVASVVNTVPNRISISGHTDQRPFAGRTDGYGNWELSADRANAARRLLIEAGVEEGKVSRVVGLASSVLFDPQDPDAPINRRISIVVLNRATDALIQEGEAAVTETPAEAPGADEVTEEDRTQDADPTLSGRS
ncbi:MAG TPA: motility protein MotB [Gammaproteobacteria bacterium]|nr:motility protein MotB [Gammaproteobacteria bacterium]